MKTTTSSPSLSQNQRLSLWILILGGGFLFFYLLSGILFPFIIGIVVAYALSPSVNFLEKYKINRATGSLCILSSFFLSIAALFLFAFPFVQDEIISLTKVIPSLGVHLHTHAMSLLDEMSKFISPEDWIRVQNYAKTFLGDSLKWLAHLIGDLLTNSLALANIIALMIVTPLVSFYFLKDWPKILNSLKALIPKKASPTILRLVKQIDDALSGFARGQALVCFILSIYYGLSLSLTGLHSGLAIGLLTGFFLFIPYVAVLTGFSIATIMSFVQFDDWTHRLVVIGIFLVGQVIEGNFLTPRLVGERIGLHPLWIIFAVFSGAYLMGFLGVLIAMPMIAIIGVLFKFLREKYLESPLYKN
ncbi:MAG: AI-2E family transporter [Proteobacteria bacterium]|nr:AI-2E family transporter [Pseudomonadota bacterium]